MLDKLKRGPAILFVLSLTGTIVAIGFGDTNIRFQSGILNYIFALLMFLLLPGALFWGAYQSRSKVVKIILSGIGLLTFLLLLLPILFTIADLQENLESGQDPNKKIIAEKILNGNHYFLYETSGNATVDFGVLLQREESFFGLKIVQRIKSVYHARDAKLEALPTGKAKLTVEPYSEKQQGLIFEFLP